MSESAARLFLQASSAKTGALGIFEAWSDEEILSAVLDNRLGRADRPPQSRRNILLQNELRYGWLWAGEASPLDEVMLAKPLSGFRILMTHGGRVIGSGVREYFAANGFRSLESVAAAPAEERDSLLDALLGGCVTQTQAAAVLEFRAGLGPFPEKLLLTRRLVLAGPPNAGKSCLLNRLAGYERAYVHAEAGATRDAVDEPVEMGGFSVLAGDLPGFSPAAVGTDLEARRRAETHVRLAETVAFVCDASLPWNREAGEAARLVAESLAGRDAVGPSVLVVLNKADLPGRIEGCPWERYFPGAPAIRLSSLPGGDAAEKMAAAAWRLWGGEATRSAETGR
ncbi:MAG: 50S ribosome-binding GTPase [Planctomycetota bacterium]|jgi:small GTP-binding protein|nr:50S ribosome-binding GTPase [Planctomycetota bacterium]